MTIQSELLAIKGDDDLLLPKDIVDWARKHPHSDLYKQFEWDNKKAAEEYRIWQARRIVAMHLTYEEGERQFISLRWDRASDGGYRDLEDVKNAPDLMEHALADALDDLRRVEQRYHFLQQLAPVWKATKEVTKRSKKRSKRPKPRGDEARP